jgi:hypothetical protein
VNAKDFDSLFLCDFPKTKNLVELRQLLVYFSDP